MKTEHNGEFVFMGSVHSYGAPQRKPREFMMDINKIDPRIADSVREMMSKVSAGFSVNDLELKGFNNFPSIENLAKNLGDFEVGQSTREFVERFAKVTKSLDNPTELRQIAKEYFKDDFPHGRYHGLRYPGRLKLHVSRRSKYVDR